MSRTPPVKHWRLRQDQGDPARWHLCYWYADRPGILYQMATVFGRELAEKIKDWLNAEQSSCETSADFSVVCKRNGIGCKLDHQVL